MAADTSTDTADAREIKRKAVAQNEFDFEGDTTRKGEVITGDPKVIESLIDKRLAVGISAMHHGVVDLGTGLLQHHKGGGNYDVLDGDGVVLNDDNLKGKSAASDFADSF